MLFRFIASLVLIVPTLAIIGRRLWWLRSLVTSGRAAPGRTDHLGERLREQAVEVFGQRKLLKWSVPGAAHFLTFWGFIVLGLTIVETAGALLLFNRDFAFWWFGRARWLGFLEDLFACLVLVALVAFAVIRLRHAPERQQRASRFYGSHTRAAWVILGMITLVILTLFLYRGAQFDNGTLPFGHSHWAFASWIAGLALGGTSHAGSTYLDVLETAGLLGQLAVVLIFGVVVVYSKHLHIGLAPLNVATKRLPDGLGPLLPVTDNAGKAIDFADVENLAEDQVFGRGKIEDFTWKGYLDFATCTECGRCQSQCPAWNTGKPLSPKLVIMDLRDHLFAKAPYILDAPAGDKAVTGVDEGGPESANPAPHQHGVPESGFGRVPEPGARQNERPLVGGADVFGVIDPDVLWSCTTCGACVEQCPVDIEHVDHITDMRRYQVLVESSFPSEAGSMLRNVESKGNPWGLAQRMREDWFKDVSFDVRKVNPGEAIPDDVEYLYWVGCAGGLEDRAKKVTVAFAELLHTAGVGFAVLGSEESCTGDPARRLGNEFVYQMQAMQNVEILNSLKPEGRPLKIVATCPHCFNTLGREYPQIGGDYEVVHHTQLLAKLVEDGHLTPVEPVDKKVTYHDPCYLGRHNKIYTPPRDVLGQIPALRSEEMHRCKERGFCCGAGGARFWMEEKIGKRINVERTDEALGLDPDIVSTACPFCMVMLSDAVTAKKQDGSAREDVAVLDVAQILRQSLATPVAPTAEAEPAPSA